MKNSSIASDIAVVERWGKAALVAGQAVARLVDAYAQFGAAFAEMLWAAYRKAGAPYGDTPEGINRWLREQKNVLDAQYLGEE